MSPQELTPKQQLTELVKKSKSILLLTHNHPDGDAVGSAIGMGLGLRKLGKEVYVVAPGNPTGPFDFLPSFDLLTQELNIQKDLLVVLDESQAQIGNISLKRVAENKLVVVITPKGGTLTASNVRIEDGSYNIDLIICLDCSNLERLAHLYDENSSLFYEVPVVNIDHHADNTNFGKVNIVDITASSTAEILVSVLETIGKEIPGIIDADIATCLLTGITTDTGSFQNQNTTPKSLTIAAQMVAAGANQQEIVRRIFRTRNLSTLRLWGRALSYIKEDTDRSFAWSVLSKADFVAAQAKPEEASGVIDELLKTASNMDFVMLISERDGSLRASLRAINPSRDVSKIAQLFPGGGGHPMAAAFSLPDKSLKDYEHEIIATIRTHLDGEGSGRMAMPEAFERTETVLETTSEEEAIPVIESAPPVAPVRKPLFPPKSHPERRSEQDRKRPYIPPQPNPQAPKPAVEVREHTSLQEEDLSQLLITDREGNEEA